MIAGTLGVAGGNAIGIVTSSKEDGSMASKKKLDPRKLMELAIKVMRQSVAEKRSDGKASPLVGAVLVKPDGTVETAYRGELRDGDHAEFTLLERKNRANALDGSILFATLEPCAPGARNHPKLCCAERIVHARIKEVWVGIEDPDPTVDRKGIKFLQERGVDVHMFDRDLQEQIREANKDFIAQAMERKAEAEAEKQPKPIILSSLESAAQHADMKDFLALEQYRKIAGIEENIESEGFQRLLLRQGLLREQGGTLVPTGFGVLLFGKRPRDLMPQAGLLGTIHYPDRQEEVRDFDGPAVLVPGQVIQWLKDKLPNPIDRSDARRKDAAEGFYEMVREGVVNALIHRDYGIDGAKCQLVVEPEVVTILSPGAPVTPITVEQLQRFDAPMLSRNPVLHYVFSRMELAEERGLGLKTMKSRAAELGLPLPVYRFENPYLELKLFRTPEGATKSLDKAILDQLPVEELRGWRYLAGRTSTTQSQYAAALQVTARTAQRHLTHFVGLGLLQRIGQGRATKYVKV